MPLTWKIVLATALGATIIAGAFVRPPRRSYPRGDVRIMVVAALALYAVGVFASLNRHQTVGVLVYVSGIAISTAAVWLSRGTDSGGPPPRDDSDEGPPPDGPDDPIDFDWDAFEREFGAYTRRRERRPVLT